NARRISASLGMASKLSLAALARSSCGKTSHYYPYGEKKKSEKSGSDHSPLFFRSKRSQGQRALFHLSLRWSKQAKLRSSLLGRAVAQSAVRPYLVVVLPPFLDLDLRLVQIHKPVLVQAFVPQTSVEALDVTVLHRLSRCDEPQLHTILVRPLIQHFARKLRS